MGLETIKPQNLYNVGNLSPEEIVLAMSGLKASLGWQILLSVIRDGDLVNFQAELNAGNFESLEQVKSLQYKIQYVTHLIGLPDELIVEYVSEQGNVEQTEDPYYSSSEEVKKDFDKPDDQMEAE